MRLHPQIASMQSQQLLLSGQAKSCHLAVALEMRSSVRHMAKQRLSSSGAAAGLGSRNRLEPLKPDEVYYFAFGSNMNPAVLTGRRLVQPKQSWPCSLPTHRLSFGVQGLPYSEPGFATVVNIPQQEQEHPQQHPCAHGVVHKITQREWASVQASEGVSSKSIGYQVVQISCHLYDGTVVQALTLQAASASMHRGRRVLPSQRYLNLLQEGARHHKLDKQYQQWLATLQPYQPSGAQKMLGTAVSGAVLLAAAAPALPVYVAGRAVGALPGPDLPAAGKTAKHKGCQSDAVRETSSSSSSSSSSRRSSSSSSNTNAGLLPFMSWYLTEAQTWTWFVHDTILTPVLGSGCNNEQQTTAEL